MMANYDLETLARVYLITTGIELSPEEFLKAGERIWNIQRLFNVREGASREDDRPPYRMIAEPLVIDDKINPPVNEDHMQRLLDEYYEESGWDTATGIPTKQKLVELDLEDAAKDVYSNSKS